MHSTILVLRARLSVNGQRKSLVYLHNAEPLSLNMLPFPFPLPPFFFLQFLISICTFSTVFFPLGQLAKNSLFCHMTRMDIKGKQKATLVSFPLNWLGKLKIKLVRKRQFFHETAFSDLTREEDDICEVRKIYGPLMVILYQHTMNLILKSFPCSHVLIESIQKRNNSISSIVSL